MFCLAARAGRAGRPAPRRVADLGREPGLGRAALSQEHADRRRGSPTPTAPWSTSSTSARASSARGACTGRSPSSASSGRSSARRDQGRAQPGPGLGRGRRRADQRHQPYPLSAQAPAAAPHHRRAGHPSARGRSFRPGKVAAFLPRSRRALRRRRHPGAGDDAAPDLGPLARMGARPRHPARMAARRDPRRHRPQAVPARGDRRDRRRSDHLDPRGAEQRPQLGLSLLLDPRRLLHRPGPQPPRRPRRPREISELSEEHRRPVQGRPHPAALRGVGRGPARGKRGRGAGRLSRHGPGAGRQRRLHQVQHDAYGQIVLSNAQAFFDERLFRKATEEDFHRAREGRRAAWERHDQPDAACGNIATAPASTPTAR